MVLVAGLMVGSVIFSGCAVMGANLVSDETLKQRTAVNLGFDEKQITITDRKPDGGDAYYNVKTDKGEEYRCMLDGNLLPPRVECAKKGEPIKRHGLGQ